MAVAQAPPATTAECLATDIAPPTDLFAAVGGTGLFMGIAKWWRGGSEAKDVKTEAENVKMEANVVKTEAKVVKMEERGADVQASRQLRGRARDDEEMGRTWAALFSEKGKAAGRRGVGRGGGVAAVGAGLSAMFLGLEKWWRPQLEAKDVEMEAKDVKTGDRGVGGGVQDHGIRPAMWLLVQKAGRGGMEVAADVLAGVEVLTLLWLHTMSMVGRAAVRAAMLPCSLVAGRRQTPAPVPGRHA